MSAVIGRFMRLLCAGGVAGAVLIGAPAASAQQQQAPSLNWQSCGDAANVECTVLREPMDYDHPNGDKVKLFVAKSPATGTRIGSLFLNFGGPGASIADFIEATGADGFPALNEHFDLIGMD